MKNIRATRIRTHHIMTARFLLLLILLTTISIFGSRTVAERSRALVLLAAPTQEASGRTTSDRQPTLVVQLGHSRETSSLAYSPDGKYVVTGGSDMARLWEVETGRELRRFEGKFPAVAAVAYSPDGRSLVTANETATLWDVETGAELRRFGNEADFVSAAVYSSGGKHLVTGDRDRARLWEVETGKEVRSFKGHSKGVSAIALSPDDKFVLTGNRDHSVTVWDMETSAELLRFEGNSLAISSLAFSPDGKHIVTAGGDHTARLWEAKTGREVRRFKLLNWWSGQGEAKTHVGDITSVAFSHDGKSVLTGSHDQTARLWDVATGREVRTFVGHSGWVVAAKFSPDGKHVATHSDDRTTRLWEIETGREVRRLEGYSAGVSSLAYSPKGRYIAIGGVDRTVQLYDVAAGSEGPRLEGHSGEVNSIAFSRSDEYVLTGSDDQTARLWEAQTGRQVCRFSGHSSQIDSVALSPGNATVLTGSRDYTARLWDLKTCQEVRKFEGHQGAVFSVAYSPNGKYVATASRDETARIWEVETGRELRRLLGHYRGVLSLTFSPDGRQVLTGSDDGTARIWGVDTGREIQRFQVTQIGVLSVAYSPDGKQILTGSGIDLARLWDAATGKELRRFEGHTGGVRAVAFSFEGHHILTGGLNDFTTRLWHLSSGKELCRFISFRGGTWVVVDPEGRFDTNNLEEIKGLHWVMADDPMKTLPLEIFMRDYYEPRLLARILNGEQFKDLRRISEVNRVQPGVEIKSIAAQKDNPELVTVTVEVGKATGEFKQGQRKITRETGVYDVRLFRDGQIVGQWPEPEAVTKDLGASRNLSDAAALDQWRLSTRVKLDNAGKQTMRFENIRLPRKADLKEIEFSAYAFNEDRVKSQTDRKSFEIPKVLTPLKGRAYLISVGVNTFENQNWNLLYAANDARLTQKILFDKLTQTGQYEAVVQVPLISDAEAKENRATKANFKAALDLLSGRKISPELIKAIPNSTKIKEARPEDLVLISFSSHGYADRGGTFYLFPADSGKGGRGRISDQMNAKLISSEELSLWLKDVDAGDMVMIVDACHAAAAVEGNEFKPGPMGSRGLGQLSYDKGMRILTATQAANVAIETGSLGHGLLTYALVREGLEQHAADFKPRDQAINLKEWLEYSAQRVPTLYEEMLSGKVKSINRATLLNGIKGRGYQQQPSLFDFAKSRREAVLVRLPSV